MEERGVPRARAPSVLGAPVGLTLGLLRAVPLVHVEVKGRVQGVGFRWFVRELAQSLALAGWVKNLASGGVEIVASGPETAISDFLEAVREGPPGAIVSDVVTLPPVASDLPKPFSIAR